MILAGGLSPAWQHVLVFDNLRVGDVNRCREVHWLASGKVLNVAVAMHRLTPPNVPVMTVVPAGGQTGDAMAEDLARLGIRHEVVRTGTATRVCTTILDRAQGTSTELVENAPGCSGDELDDYRGEFARHARDAAVVVLTGSLPADTPASYYRDLVATVSCPVVLDVRGPELLRALERNPLLVKPNRAELGRTLGRSLERDEDLARAMGELRDRGAQWVVVTDGSGLVWTASPRGLVRFRPPAITPVLNPIGSGDCMAAGIAVALARGEPPLEAIRYGIAAAADNVRHLLPARIDQEAVASLRETVEIIPQ